ncbi:MaoC family dehydratase N-terminal domain-containing protein [Bacillus marasmi]|uniref:MaoC family dehydratase N-terminal domain-containing protein n=1 Tax=Bacillus marasmi TaxID=1926279 RepID=UPI0011C8F97A|nr:MaoC family dehydratase N-terminal domain-containing protein [Bacillus marasmi]
MLNNLSSKLGLEFAPYSFSVERGKIKEFAQAIGDDNNIYHNVEAARAAGFRDIPITPTFATVIDMWAGPNFEQLMETLEVNPLKVLHGEMQYTYLGDICAGDTISCTSKVTEVTEKRKMNFFTIETEYKNQDDKLVLISKSLIIERP